MEMAQFAMVEELAALVKDNLFSKHLVLSTEETFVDFVQNNTCPDGILELQPMTSYDRLLIHRLADIFGLTHESFGEGDDRHLVIERGPESAMPTILVGDILWKFDDSQPTATTTHILRREALPEFNKNDIFYPPMTVEDREAAYMAARKRIFSAHEDDEKHSFVPKPRTDPVVARRMIAHALGKTMRFESSDRDTSQNHEECEMLKELHIDKEKDDATVGDAAKMSAHLASKKVQINERRTCSGGPNSRSSENSRPVPSGNSVRAASTQNLKREQHGAAKRIFAHALGLPSTKNLKCSERNKDFIGGC